MSFYKKIDLKKYLVYYIYMFEKGIKNNLEILKYNNDTFLYNDKVYKTEAAAKKAKTMDAKRTIKENKKNAYHQKHGEEKIQKAVEKRAIKKDQKDFSKQLLNIGSIYDEENLNKQKMDQVYNL